MNFNELAAIFVKLSRRLDGSVNTPKFEFRHCESLSWDLNIYSHRRLSEFQKLVNRANFLALEFSSIWKLTGVSLVGSGIPQNKVN